MFMFFSWSELKWDEAPLWIAVTCCAAECRLLAYSFFLPWLEVGQTRHHLLSWLNAHVMPIRMVETPATSSPVESAGEWRKAAEALLFEKRTAANRTDSSAIFRVAVLRLGCLWPGGPLRTSIPSGFRLQAQT
jgi:hypothetical protein